MRNINGLIIPAESEIKDIPFLLLLPNRWWSDLASPKALIEPFCAIRIQNPDPPKQSLHVDVTGGGIDSHNKRRLCSKLSDAATVLNALGFACHMAFLFKMHPLN